MLVALGATLVTSAAPIVYPRIITSTWGRESFALYLTIQGWGSILAMADLGLQAYLAREVVDSVARGEHGRAKGLFFAGRRAYAVAVGVLALALAVYVSFVQSWPESVTMSAGGPTPLRIAILIQLLSSGALTAIGSLATIAELAVGRDRDPLWFSMVQSLAQVAILAAAALLHIEPVHAFVAAALGNVVLVALRGQRARLAFSPVFRDVAPVAPPLASIARGVAASMGIVGGQLLQVSLAPLVLTTRDAFAATVAIPGRTLGNVAAKLPATIGTTLWPRLARSAAQGDAARHRENELVFLFGLTGLQLVAASGLALVGDRLFAFWLPKLAGHFDEVLPAIVAEQSVLAIAGPLVLTLFAAGHLRALAIAHTATGAAMVLALLALPHLELASLSAIATAAMALIHVPLLLRSVRSHTGVIGTKQSWAVAATMLFTLAIASGRVPRALSVTGLALAGLTLLAIAARALRQRSLESTAP